VKSGPDVFADALVPEGRCRPWPGQGVRRFCSPNLPPLFRIIPDWSPRASTARVVHLAPMVIVLPNGRVNQIFPIGGNPGKIGISAILRRWPAQGVYAGFIEILKLPFKFDRS